MNCPSHGLVAHPIKLNVRRRSEKVDNTRMKAVRMVKVDMSLGWLSKHIDRARTKMKIMFFVAGILISDFCMSSYVL